MDRISDLPNIVLSHTLSLLPTKLAASTCVLSKRWQHVWTMVYNLDLECYTDISQLQSNLLIEQATRSVMNFANFVSKIFTQRVKDLCIKKFRLKLYSPSRSIRVNSWVLAVMSSRLEEVDIHLTAYRFGFTIPCSISSCKTLVVLKLNDAIAINPPSSIHFPNLKVLHLLLVRFENQHSFNNLFSGCPILENLVLGAIIDTEEFSDYVITSLTLRELVIDCYYYEIPMKIWVDAPSLEYLNLKLFVSGGNIFLKNLGNLLQAVVDLDFEHAYLEEVEKFHMVEDSLKALYNVQVLELKQITKWAICEASFVEFPVFRNLVRLELDDFCCVCRMLLALLQKLPYLQHLTLRYEQLIYNGTVFLGNEAWAELSSSNCLSHLKTLCFYRAFGRYNDNNLSCGDMEFVTYVLKNSTVLENVTITCRDCLSEEKKGARKQELASLERGSKKCELKFEGEVL